MRRPILEFWYDFASPYSYLAAMRIEALAGKADVSLRWRPFLLGPIFAAQGWATSPFNLFPAKGRYMWRDLEREAAAQGAPMVRPTVFPQNGLLAARIALIGADQGWIPAFTGEVFGEEFGKGYDISERAVIERVLLRLSLDADRVMEQAQAEGNKLRLRRVVDDALTRGIFGTPTFIAEDGDMFWGNDRLERALAWAAQTRLRPDLGRDLD